MKAIVKSKAEPGLWIEDVPEPEMGINDVMIRVKKGGICGTDLHIYNWDAWAQATIKVPTTIGHEFVGEIVDVGSNVVDFAAGDIVSVEGHDLFRQGNARRYGPIENFPSEGPLLRHMRPRGGPQYPWHIDPRSIISRETP